MPGPRRRRGRDAPWDDEIALPSGLTGSVDIPDPPPPPRLPRRERARAGAKSAVATAAGLPRVLRLCWRASAWATVTLALLTVVVGLFPALTASTARLLVDAVVAAVQAACPFTRQPFPGDGAIVGRHPFASTSSSANGPSRSASD